MVALFAAKQAALPEDRSFCFLKAVLFSKLCVLVSSKVA